MEITGMTQNRFRSRVLPTLALAALFFIACVGASRMLASPTLPTLVLPTTWFLTVIDQGGVNDVGSVDNQNDMTQMGRDDDDNWLHLYWSWDNASWSGGNKGDACALLDSDGD